MMPRLAAAVGSLRAVRLRICHGGDPPLGDRGRVGLSLGLRERMQCSDLPTHLPLDGTAPSC